MLCAPVSWEFGGAASLSAMAPRQFLKLRLMDAGTWVQKDVLLAGSVAGVAALEDALADLVLENFAQYRAGVGYRLGGGKYARQAVRELRRRRVRRYLVSRSEGGVCRMGVAEVVGPGVLDVVVYELEMPEPAVGDMNRFVERVMGFVNGPCMKGAVCL